MSGYLAQAGGVSAPPAPPPIPGLEQGTPSASNRPATAPTSQQVQGSQGVIAGTPEQIRDQLRNEIQNAIRDGTMPMINVPSDFVQNAVPQGAVDISIAMFASLAFVIVGLPIARAFGRRMDARSQGLASGSANLGPQIAQLQDSVDAMAIEMERITEAQRFQSKLLSERKGEPARLER